jgi:hypothetical protein
VTVWTQDPKIDQAIVVTSSVDVVQFQRHSRSIPTIATADLAPWCHHPFPNQAPFQVTGVNKAPFYEVSVEGSPGNNGNPAATSPRPAMEVRGVQAQLPDAGLQSPLVTTRPQVQPGKNLSERPRQAYRSRDVLVRAVPYTSSPTEGSQMRGV